MFSCISVRFNGGIVETQNKYKYKKLYNDIIEYYEKMFVIIDDALNENITSDEASKKIKSMQYEIKLISFQISKLPVPNKKTKRFLEKDNKRVQEVVQKFYETIFNLISNHDFKNLAPENLKFPNYR